MVSVFASDNQICTGSSIPIMASGAQNYIWTPATGLSSTAGGTVIAAPTSNTTYTVFGSNTSGSVTCQSQTSFNLNVLQYAQAIVPNNIILCEGESIFITAGGGNTYSWTPSYGLNNTVQPNVVANPTTSTIYYVSVSNNYSCATTSSVLVMVAPKPIVDAGKDTTFNIDQQMSINSIGTGTLTWIYGEGIHCKDCPSTEIYPNNSSCYVIQATNQYGCTALDEVCVEVTKEYTFYVPNAFSPNGDGINDIFYIYGDGIYNVVIDIFDRWGNKVFSSKDQTVGWNGIYNGQKCEIGVYSYHIEYMSIDSRQHYRDGHVTILANH